MQSIYTATFSAVTIVKHIASPLQSLETNVSEAVDDFRKN
jgi:hypothetical protein